MNQVRALFIPFNFQFNNMPRFHHIRQIIFNAFFMMLFVPTKAQDLTHFSSFPALPDKEGFAGMFAGVSNGSLFCMGGANFPGKRPWEGGIKKWYAHIYRFNGRQWTVLPQVLKRPLAYGVSVTWKDEIIIAGGNNADAFYNDVTGWRWTGDSFSVKSYPSLPLSLASMTGCIVDHLLILAGGSTSNGGKPLNIVVGLDLHEPARGWFELPAIPAAPRQQAVCASYQKRFYLFSGEGAAVLDDNGKPMRQLLQDAWMLQTVHTAGGWSGKWQALPEAPKSVSASASPVPVSAAGCMIFWGGVDKKIIQHTDPATHPGLGSRLLYFDAQTHQWTDKGELENQSARVTLPTVFYNNEWLYISGEIRAGIRTNMITSLKTGR